jgi:hypothetical protein
VLNWKRIALSYAIRGKEMKSNMTKRFEGVCAYLPLHSRADFECVEGVDSGASSLVHGIL